MAPKEGAAARLRGVTLDFGSTRALDSVDLEIPAGRMVALIGPDGVGKSSLFSLVAGAREIQQGQVEVLGGDMADADHRKAVCPRIAYMPQGLGKNLYPTLSVVENLEFFARLFGQGAEERAARIDSLLESTGLSNFRDRPAGKLSGGMKQKLGLCCSLIHDPDLLLLDEPTTGVDPLSRAQFWTLIARIRHERPQMSVLVATAYMDEAEGFEQLVAMDAGKILAIGSLAEILERTSTERLEDAFIALLPEERRHGHEPVEVKENQLDDADIAIEASGLTKRFGDFTAVDHVDFRIRRGEIFGFLGSNGCGKSTTMKMLTGLLTATEGDVELFGQPVTDDDMAVRKRVGYMSQAFSLYSELSVRQNLELHARLFHVPADMIDARVKEMADYFDLGGIMDAMPDAMPLGQRQRLSLAVAMIHEPELLILDEPTSGVDPIARDQFWQIMIDLSRERKVTIFLSTHFMNEAERCDRISLMHAGKVLVSDTPAKIVADRGAPSLEQAFIDYLREAEGEQDDSPPSAPQVSPEGHEPYGSAGAEQSFFSIRRMLSYSRRETLELRRDPIRATIAFLGSLLLMLVISYGLNSDVQDVPFAVLDRDDTTVSREYIQNISGSRYFVERAPIRNDDDLDQRMRRGELAAVIEIPDGFSKDVAGGTRAEIGAWVDGSMPDRAETVRGYLNRIHQDWVEGRARVGNARDLPPKPSVIEMRYRYNPDVESLNAIVPAVMPIMLLLFPAMLTALSIVREKELGSIINFYVTPVTRVEFLIGKQLPYVVLAMANYVILLLIAWLLFGIAITGSVLAMTVGALLYTFSTTAIGILFSVFIRSQIAAIFATAIGTTVPALSFSGLMNPVASLSGAGRIIGSVYPTSHFITICRGVFSKGLGFIDLYGSMLALAVTYPVLLGICALLLRKQER